MTHEHTFSVEEICQILAEELIRREKLSGSHFRYHTRVVMASCDQEAELVSATVRIWRP